MKKVVWYLAVRLYELKICMKEFSRGSKLNKANYRAFVDNGMLVEVHSVEKGLGLKNSEPGHSASVVRNLLNRLNLLANDRNRVNSYAFKETFRVLMAYFDFQEEFDTSKFEQYEFLKKEYDKLCAKLGNDYVEKIKYNLKAGSYELSKEELLQGTEFDFGHFISSRHSIRVYEKSPLRKEEIIKAVQIANASPSACNRQPNYVYFCSDKERVQNIDSLITGSSGFKGETPNYLIVTTDRACFSYVEQFQWYINGGIYLSYLSLALHSLGIGHCIMQWKAFYSTENELKKICGISKSEAIIAVIGCGYYADNVKCIRAQRKTVDDTLHII